MRFVSTLAAIAFAALSLWLWLELRSTWDTFNSSVLSNHQSLLLEARRVETMLTLGETDKAIAYLQSRRDLAVVLLGDFRTAISLSSWHWPDQTLLVEEIARFYGEEMAYRSEHGPTSSELSERASKLLGEVRE